MDDTHFNHFFDTLFFNQERLYTYHDLLVTIAISVALDTIENKNQAENKIHNAKEFLLKFLKEDIENLGWLFFLSPPLQDRIFNLQNQDEELKEMIADRLGQRYKNPWLRIREWLTEFFMRIKGKPTPRSVYRGLMEVKAAQNQIAPSTQ